MKKVVRIKESELVNLIDKIITETTRKQKISEGVRNLAGKQIIKEEVKYMDANDSRLIAKGDESIDIKTLKLGDVIAPNRHYRDREELENEAGQFTGVKNGYVTWKTKNGKVKEWNYPEDLVLVKNLINQN